MTKVLAEAFGAFVLVFFGVGAAVLAGDGLARADPVSIIAVSLAFGAAYVAMAQSVGQVSGAHLNPAVSFGWLLAGRMTAARMGGFWIGQIGGAVLAAAAVFLIASSRLDGHDLAAAGLGQNGWGEGYGAGYGLAGAFMFEVIATAVLVAVMLGASATSRAAGAEAAGTSGGVARSGGARSGDAGSGGAEGAGGFAGLAAGLTLTMIHLAGLAVSGASVNPARSIGPALFAGGQALGQLWLFIVAPLIGAAVGAALHRARVASPDGG